MKYTEEQAEELFEDLEHLKKIHPEFFERVKAPKQVKEAASEAKPLEKPREEKPNEKTTS